MCWQLVLCEAHRGEGKERGALRGGKKTRSTEGLSMAIGPWAVGLLSKTLYHCGCEFQKKQNNAVHAKLDCVLTLRWILDMLFNFRFPSKISSAIFLSLLPSLSIIGLLINLFFSEMPENRKVQKLWLASTCFRPDDTFIKESPKCNLWTISVVLMCNSNI